MRYGGAHISRETMFATTTICSTARAVHVNRNVVHVFPTMLSLFSGKSWESQNISLDVYEVCAAVAELSLYHHRRPGAKATAKSPQSYFPSCCWTGVHSTSSPGGIAALYSWTIWICRELGKELADALSYIHTSEAPLVHDERTQWWRSGTWYKEYLHSWSSKK